MNIINLHPLRTIGLLGEGGNGKKEDIRLFWDSSWAFDRIWVLHIR